MNAPNQSNDADLISSPWPVLTRPVVDGFNPTRDTKENAITQEDRGGYENRSRLTTSALWCRNGIFTARACAALGV